MSRVLLVGVLILSIVSCSKMITEPLASNFQDSKLVLSFQKDIEFYSDTLRAEDYLISCTKVPYQIELLQRLELGNITHEEYEQLRDEKSEYELFYLEYQRLDSKKEFFSSSEKYSAEDKFNFLLYQLKNEIKMITGVDTFSTTGFHLEQNPLFPSRRRIQVYFPKSKQTAIQVFIHSNPIVGSNLEFKITNINKKLN